MQRETCLLSAAAKRSPVETAKCQTSHGMIIKCETQLRNSNDALELRRDIFRRRSPERAIKGHFFLQSPETTQASGNILCLTGLLISL